MATSSSGRTEFLAGNNTCRLARGTLNANQISSLAHTQHCSVNAKLVYWLLWNSVAVFGESHVLVDLEISSCNPEEKVNWRMLSGSRNLTCLLLLNLGWQDPHCSRRFVPSNELLAPRSYHNRHEQHRGTIPRIGNKHLSLLSAKFFYKGHGW